MAAGGAMTGKIRHTSRCGLVSCTWLGSTHSEIMHTVGSTCSEEPPVTARSTMSNWLPLAAPRSSALVTYWKLPSWTPLQHENPGALFRSPSGRMSAAVLESQAAQASSVTFCSNVQATPGAGLKEMKTKPAANAATASRHAFAVCARHAAHAGWHLDHRGLTSAEARSQASVQPYRNLLLPWKQRHLR